MRLRLGAVALALLFAVGVPAGAADAATGAATRLTVSAATTTVSGRAVDVRVTLVDAQGNPIADGLIRLVSTVTFLAADRDEIMDEARTSASGRASLTFAPTQPGAAKVTARYSGDSVYAGSEDSLAFDVRQPIVAYHPTPVGIAAPWARSSLALLPFAAVWIVYLLVLGLARKVRRVGVVTSGPDGSAI